MPFLSSQTGSTCGVPNARFVLALCFASWLLPTITATAQVDRVFESEANGEQTFRHVTITSDPRFAVAAFDEGVVAWERSTGKQLFSVSRDIDHIVVSPDNSQMVFWDDDNDQLCGLKFDGVPESWKITTLIRDFENDVDPLAMSPDNRLLACKIDYEHIGIFDLAQKKLVFQQKIAGVEQVVFSPDGKQIAFSFDRSEHAVVTYSIEQQKQITSSASFISSAAWMAYSPDGQSLAVSCVMSNEYSIVLLDAEQLRPIRGARFAMSVSPSYCVMDWSDDGQLLAASGVAPSYATIGIFDVTNRKLLTTLLGHKVSQLAFSPDATRILSVSGDDVGVTSWDWASNLKFREAATVVASHPRLDNYKDDHSVDLRLRFSPDGKSIALAIPEPYDFGMRSPLAATTEAGLVPSIDFSKLDAESSYIFILDAATGKPTKAIVSNAPGMTEEDGDKLYGSMFEAMEFSPDNGTLATLFSNSASDDGHLVLWDIAAARPRIELLIRKTSGSWNEGWIDLKYVDGGKSLLLLCEDRDRLGVQVLDLASSTVKRSVKGAFGKTLLVMPNGQFASGLGVWDYVNGEALFQFNEGSSRDYHTLARSAGGSIVAISYDRDHLGEWNLDTLKLTFPYSAHRIDPAIEIRDMAASPNGQLIATACVDHLIRIWEAETGRLLGNLRGHQRAVDALCFSPDGSRLVSASRDGTTRFWDVSDLGNGKQIAEEPVLPSRRTFQTSNGATITVVFDHKASEAEIAAALKEAQSQIVP